MRAFVRLRNWLGLALSAAGIALLSYWAGVTIDARVFQRQLAQRLETTESSKPVSAVLERADSTRHEARANGLVGRLEIPRLGISAMVVEGVTKRSLRHGIGHVPNTAFPGEQGNVGLAAHRDTYFRGLKDVARGDRIRLDTPDGVFSYEVEWFEVVDPDRVDVLGHTSQPVLTLVTCYPFYWVGNAPKRFVVRCRSLGDSALAGSAPGAGADPTDSLLEAPARLPGE